MKVGSTGIFETFSGGQRDSPTVISSIAKRTEILNLSELYQQILPISFHSWLPQLLHWWRQDEDELAWRGGDGREAQCSSCMLYDVRRTPRTDQGARYAGRPRRMGEDSQTR